MTRIVVVYVASDGNPQKAFYDDANASVEEGGALLVRRNIAFTPKPPETAAEEIRAEWLASMLALFAPGVWRRVEWLEMPEGKS